MIGMARGRVKPGASVRTRSTVVSCTSSPAVVDAPGGNISAMDTPNRRPPLPIGLPDADEPEEPDDILFDEAFADDIVVDAIPAASPMPPPPPAPTRVVPPADRIRESGAAEWFGNGGSAVGPESQPSPTPAPLRRWVDPFVATSASAGPSAGSSALDTVLGVPMPPMPASARKSPPPSRRPANFVDLAARYDARLRISGLTGDDLLRRRLDASPPDILKAAVVRFGRGADPTLSPVRPIDDAGVPSDDESQ